MLLGNGTDGMVWLILSRKGNGWGSLKVVHNEKRGGLSKMAVVSFDGTQVIEVCLLFDFAVVFSSMYFLFCKDQTNH
jgi:hypothetical protein